MNEELSHRHAELNRAQSDILNLLNLMNVAILFLDRGLRIQRFTSTAREMLNLIPSDVGRSIRDIRLGVKIPDLGGPPPERHGFGPDIGRNDSGPQWTLVFLAGAPLYHGGQQD